MIGSILTALGRLARSILWKAVRAGVLALVIGIVVIEVLAAILNKAAGAHGFVSFHIWPPAFNTDVFTEFVHLAAALFGLALAMAVALAVVLFEAVRILMLMANHVDDTAQAMLNRLIGMNTPAVDAAQQAAQRPDRRGIVRDPEL